MNVRPRILGGLILVVALLVALIVWLRTNNVKTAPAAPELTVNAGTEPAEPAAAPPKHAVTHTPESGPVDSDVPIVFYGRLEDQGSEPVVGAEVTGTTIFHRGTTGATGQVVATSDANGLFTLNAGVGE